MVGYGGVLRGHPVRTVESAASPRPAPGQGRTGPAACLQRVQPVRAICAALSKKVSDWAGLLVHETHSCDENGRYHRRYFTGTGRNKDIS